MKKKPKKNNYTKQKYPALNAKYQVGTRRELIDYDYIDKLSPEEKKWLDNFTAEFIITNFDHDGEKLITDQEEKRALWRANNHRNGDVFANTKIGGTLDYGMTLENADKFKSANKKTKSLENTNQTEDYLNTLIEVKRAFKKNTK